jgi:hypothetical protein
MQNVDEVDPVVAEIASIMNVQEKNFLETSQFLSCLVFCDSEDMEKIEELQQKRGTILSIAHDDALNVRT